MLYLCIRSLAHYKALYENARAIFNHDGNEYVVLSFLSGVLQGCPASGMLFNSALDPFLLAFCTVLGNGTKGILRGCADDIGFALSRLSHLNLLYPIYQKAEALAGLALHPSKCVLVPLCEASEHHTDSMIL